MPPILESDLEVLAADWQRAYLVKELDMADDIRHRLELAILEFNRGRRIVAMCDNCKTGHWQPCDREGCKCLCNDIRPANLRPVPIGQASVIDYGKSYG